jgi:hypothetical protein
MSSLFFSSWDARTSSHANDLAPSGPLIRLTSWKRKPFHPVIMLVSEEYQKEICLGSGHILELFNLSSLSTHSLGKHGTPPTKFQRSQKCCTRSTTLGPTKVIEVSCQAEWPCQLCAPRSEDIWDVRIRGVS